MTDGPAGFDRRALLKMAVGAGIGVTCRPARADAQADNARRPVPGDLLVRADDPSRAPLRPADIPDRAAPLLVWAMDPATGVVRSGSRLNQIIVMRFPPDELKPRTRERSADGVVAYTAICTHSGCETVDWIAGQKALACGCHDSLFDPADEAAVLSGPAPRPLAALPLQTTEGRLTVAAPFSAAISFESP